MWFRCSTCRPSGSPAGHRCAIRTRLRCPAICPKPGGANHRREATTAVRNVMILGSPQPQKTAGAGGRITLDDLFRAAVAQRPDDVALLDPPNREAFTSGAPRRLTYAQADRAVTAIAARL